MNGNEPRWRNVFELPRLARTATAWLFATQGSMRELALRGTIWLLLAEAITRVASLVKLAVLGRLLSPRDFGVLGVAMLVQNWIGSFTQTGISSTLIQKNAEVRDYLNTAWTIGLIRGSVVFTLIYALASPAAAYFRSPESAPIIRVVAALPLLWELANPGVVHLRRELDFRRDVAWRISGVLPGLLTGIVLAFVLRNVWALAASLLASRVAEVIASYRIHPYRPRLEFQRSRARSLMRTSKWFSWMNVAGFFEYQLDSLLTARWLGARALGYYQVAAQMALLPTAGLGSRVAAVLFAAFARLDTSERRRRAFMNSLAALALVVLPLASAIACFPAVLVRLALGRKWDPIVAPLAWLAMAGSARALGAVSTALLQATSRLKIAMLLQLSRILLLGLLLYTLAPPLGITGTAAAVAISAVLVSGVQVAIASRAHQARPAEIASALKWGGLAALPFPVLRLVTIPLRPGWQLPSLLLAGLACAVVLVQGLKARFGFSLAAARLPAPALSHR